MNENYRGHGSGCHLRGKPAKNRKYPWHSDKDECLKMYKDGKTTKQILAHYGLNWNKNIGEQLRKFLKKNGFVLDSRGNIGCLNPSWKGGKIIEKGNYVLIHCPSHPYANSAGYVREHRLVMEQYLGRYLNNKEVVHHINKDVQDNRIENLELFASNGCHLASELQGKCPNWSVEGLKRLQEVRRLPKFHKPSSIPEQLKISDL